MGANLFHIKNYKKKTFNQKTKLRNSKYQKLISIMKKIKNNLLNNIKECFYILFFFPSYNSQFIHITLFSLKI